MSARGQGDRGVPRSLAGTPTTTEDGNHCRGSTATTVINTLKVAGTVLKLAMMHLYEASQETRQSDRQLTASDDRTLVAAGQETVLPREMAARGRPPNKSSLPAPRATTAKK